MCCATTTAADAAAGNRENISIKAVGPPVEAATTTIRFGMATAGAAYPSSAEGAGALSAAGTEGTGARRVVSIWKGERWRTIFTMR